MCRSSARAARLIFSPLSHRRRARLKASRGVVLILGVVTLVPFADPGIILAGARHGGYGHPPLYPKVFEWRVDTEVMQYLGLQQFGGRDGVDQRRSEEHTSELQSRPHLVCRLLLEKKKRDRKSW